jgi:hypothetical protein
MKSLILETLFILGLLTAGLAEARKSSSFYGYGQGSKSSSTRVSGYT